MAAGKAKMFDTWMYESSDLVQHAARSFGDRLVMERCNVTFGEVDPSLTQVLGMLDRIFMCVSQGLIFWPSI